MTDEIKKFQLNKKQIDFQNEKKSISKSLYAEDVILNSIFNNLNKPDANGNIDDILDEKELQNFQQKIIDAAGEDGNLSTEEGRLLLDSMGLKNVETNKLFEFIQHTFSKDQESTVNFDTTKQLEQEEEQITRGIIVQNGESPAIIAKKFGVHLQDLLKANKDVLKGKDNKKYFLVGQEIIIPRKIEADELATLTASRKSAEETKRDYAQEDTELKELGLTERTSGKVEAYYAKKPHNKITLKKIGNAKNGRSICVDQNGNYIVVAQNGIILKTDFVKNPEKYEQTKKYNENVKIRKNAESLAQQFYKIADDNSGMGSMKKMQELLDKKINSQNIVAFLDAYDRENTKQGDSSIIDTITSEVGAGGTKQQRQVLMSIIDKLCDAAKKSGVSNGDIQKAKHDFETSLNKEFNAVLRRTNPKDMEKAVDFLRGAIASKLNTGVEISDQDAINQFNSTFATENTTAQKDYKDARENEGWTAKVGDTVCGWFGCNTIEDMDKKLGKNAAAVQKLANSKTEADFKKNYKEIFGIEFDKNKIAARQTAIDKYNLAQNCNSTIKITDKILKSSGSYSNLRNELKTNFKYDDETINQIIDSYSIQAGKRKTTDNDKKELLIKFLQDTKTNATQNYQMATAGKTLEQMGKDIDLITRSAFGTNDIVKDVIQFNENQQITETVTEAGFEIAGTIALQFIPGLGQIAAARLAVSAARWGTKAVKVVNYAKKAEKVFSNINKFQTGKVLTNTTSKTSKAINKGFQVASQMINTGVATATVDLTNGKSVKETTKKALMNMSFAGVGASSSILAPKLMQAFGITNKAFATEIAEEIINAAGSYGVTKLQGEEYGSTDAFIDFASGLIISRISHVKSSGIKPQNATIPDVPKVDKPETPKTKTEPTKAEIKPSETSEVIVKPKPDEESSPQSTIAISTNENVTQISTQPKYTKEFEPAYNDTPVSNKLIEERLGVDNPELKKLNEEFASGNSMLQKQVEIESAIENLNHRNYSPEYVESIREKIKEISIGNPKMEKSYNELLDMAANEASLERASLIREKEYIERTYGTHKSAQESAEVFSDHLEQVNAAKENDYIRRTYQNPSGKSAAESAEVFSDYLEQVNTAKENDYIRRTYQNPSGKSAAESAEVFEKQMPIRDKIKTTDEQLHQKNLLDGDELFERITHSNNPELQKLGAEYKKLEDQEQNLKHQIEILKEQIRRKAQTSADDIDSRFRHSNPELDIMNTKYRSLEMQQEKLKTQVEKLKQQMHEKIYISADDIDLRLSQRTGDYEDLAADLRNRETIGEIVQKELELEKAEQAAVKREQAFIDRTYNTTHKSANESARVFEEKFIKEQIQEIEFAIGNINIAKAEFFDIYALRQQIDTLTDTSLKNKYKQILDNKLASIEDNLTRQRRIKEKLEEYKKAYAADDAAYQKAQDDGSYYSTKPDGFSYWASSDKVKHELDEILGYDKNSRATFYAEELLDASKMGYIDDGSIAYPFLASKILSTTPPNKWKGMCNAIEFSKRIKSGKHINSYEVIDVLKNLDQQIYNQEIKDEIKNIYGLDLETYRRNLVDWLDNEYSNSLSIKIPQEAKIKLTQNVLNNKKTVKGSITEIKSELEKAIPILKDNPKTEIIAKELKELENNPEFNKLDDLHKTIAKWSIIIQNMRFKESAAILREYNIPSVIQDRIIYSTIKDSQALAGAMMHSGDIEMFSIIDNVKRKIDSTYDGVDIEELKSNIARINDVNNQNFIFSNTPETSAIPIQTVSNHGRNYKVKFVNLNDPKVLSNLEDYGFLPGTNPNDLEFVVHMFGHGKEEEHLTRLYNATKNKETVVLSTSLTNGTNRLYDHGNIGVVVDYDQNSILNAFNDDLVSGRQKSQYQAQWQHKISNDMSGRTKGQEYSLVKNELKNKLGLNDSEYLELTNYLRNKRSLGQIKDIQISDKKLSGTEIQKALKESQKKLYTGYEGYNEIEIFNPTMKAIYIRDIDIANVPSYIFEYAQKHNLPIIYK